MCLDVNYPSGSGHLADTTGIVITYPAGLELKKWINENPISAHGWVFIGPEFDPGLGDGNGVREILVNVDKISMMADGGEAAKKFWVLDFGSRVNTINISGEEDPDKMPDWIAEVGQVEITEKDFDLIKAEVDPQTLTPFGEVMGGRRGGE